MKIVLLCRSFQCLFLFDPLLIKHVQNLKGADTHVTQFGIYNKILNKADNQTFDYFSNKKVVDECMMNSFGITIK